MNEASPGQALCRRTVHARSGDDVISIEVGMGAPVPDPERKIRWRTACPPGMEALLDPPHQTWRVAGYDGFQALSLALEHVGRLLDQTGLKWTAFPGEQLVEGFSGEPDDAFWRPMASGVPVKFRRKMERLVREETEKAYADGEIRAIHERMRSGRATSNESSAEGG